MKFFIQDLFWAYGETRKLILFDLTDLTMSAWRRMDSISWFDLGLHSPFRKKGPWILLTALLLRGRRL